MAVWELVDVLCRLVAEAIDFGALILAAFEGPHDGFVQILQLLLLGLPALFFQFVRNESCSPWRQLARQDGCEGGKKV